jgi:hypothetical protein
VTACDNWFDLQSTERATDDILRATACVLLHVEKHPLGGRQPLSRIARTSIAHPENKEIRD